MKSKEKKQLVSKTISELGDEIKKVQAEIVGLRLDRVQGKLKNTSSLTNKRKDIAVLKTVMRIKEIENENI